MHMRLISDGFREQKSHQNRWGEARYGRIMVSEMSFNTSMLDFRPLGGPPPYDNRMRKGLEGGVRGSGGIYS